MSESGHDAEPPHGEPTPMFPLGSVLLPTMAIALHVFEPRYRQLVDDVLGRSDEFGIVLIERGSEVGGGDVRSPIGCLARIVDARRSPDGRWQLAVLGTHRIAVERWLTDDPYPRAEVVALADPTQNDREAETASATTEALVRRFRTVCALAVEAGAESAPIDIALSHDPTEAVYQMAGLGPFGAFDRQRLLAASGLGTRHAVLDEMLEDAEIVLRDHLGGGPGSP